MDTFDYMKLRAELDRDEGRRSKMYQDSEGVWTIGVGWNLEANGLPSHVIDELLDISIATAEKDARRLFKNFESLTLVRQRVVINMAFNLGHSRLSGFKNMIAAVHAGDWMKAADEMMNSKWARQVGSRADRLAVMMRLGSE